jgi:hypothetical protein
MRFTNPLLASLLLLLAGAVHAIDGQYEINAACVSLGCFPGDTAGWPVTITESGSYVLSSNLTTEDNNQVLISVQASNVSINLNGFSLIGPVSCSGVPPNCDAATGSGDGIRLANNLHAVRIHNGSIRGMGQYGIQLPGTRGFSLYDLHFSENRRSAILTANAGGMIRNIVIANNGEHGIWNTTGPGRFHLLASHIENIGGRAVNNGGYCQGNVFFKHGVDTIGEIHDCNGSFGDNFCIGVGDLGAC